MQKITYLLIATLITLSVHAQTLRNGQYIAISNEDFPGMVITKDTTFNHVGYKTILLEPGASKLFRWKITKELISTPIAAKDYVSGFRVSVEAGKVIGINRDSWIRYSINIVHPTTKFIFKYSRGNAGSGTMQIRVGRIDSTPIATVLFPFTGTKVGDWTTYIPLSTGELPIPSGTQDIYFTFTTGVQLGNLNLEAITVE